LFPTLALVPDPVSLIYSHHLITPPRARLEMMGRFASHSSLLRDCAWRIDPPASWSGRNHTKDFHAVLHPQYSETAGTDRSFSVDLRGRTRPAILQAWSPINSAGNAAYHGQQLFIQTCRTEHPVPTSSGCKAQVLVSFKPPVFLAFQRPRLSFSHLFVFSSSSSLRTKIHGPTAANHSWHSWQGAAGLVH
jgi:hypothetical protein